MTRKSVRPYHEPAGGWGALKALSEALLVQRAAVKGAVTLSRMNQPEGFDCPGCAWPDPKHTSSFEFCENGGKAVAWEATAKRCTPEFFAAHTVTELAGWSDYDLEMVGRLTHPMAYDALSDRYLPVQWSNAFDMISRYLRALPDPNMADFYTSGRTSNEAAFLYQLFVREYGTNNFPDCSNMCHEATSVGLPQSIGVGKGTVLLEDFDKADCIFIFGQNPGTNSPRMMTSLRNAARRGASIISFNPFRERALERFQAPQSPLEMITLTSTTISSRLFQVRVGGDVAALKGIMKILVEADEAARAAEQPAILDWDFIRGHTDGIEALIDDLKRTQWPAIERQCGLTREDMEYAANAYMKSERAILVYGMGITQHQRGTHNVQQIANLALLRGNMGREGAGVCPVRGHSNVQGDRTVGITEVPGAEFLGRLERRFGFKPPSAPGHNTVTALEAMIRGEVKVFFAMGGNFAAAIPDWQATRAALRNLDLTVHVSTKLNRSHLIHGHAALILPCLGRTEIDVQASGPQSITVEELDVDGPCLGRAQQAGVGASPERAGDHRGHGQGNAWRAYGGRLGWLRCRIRSHPRCDRGRLPDLPGLQCPHPRSRRLPSDLDRPGAHLGNGIRQGELPGVRRLGEDPPQSDPDVLWLTTIRSHDQYNTTLYSMSDRYRGVFGQRDVVFLNEYEIKKARARRWRPRRSHHGIDRRRRTDRAQLPRGRPTPSR